MTLRKGNYRPCVLLKLNLKRLKKKKNLVTWIREVEGINFYHLIDVRKCKHGDKENFPSIGLSNSVPAVFTPSLKGTDFLL